MESNINRQQYSDTFVLLYQAIVRFRNPKLHSPRKEVVLPDNLLREHYRVITSYSIHYTKLYELIILAGVLETSTGNVHYAWSITFFIVAGIFISLMVYHRFILPKPDSDKKSNELSPAAILKEFGKTFVTFFAKKNVLIALAFFLLYRLGEAMLVKIASPFLLDSRELGGLGLSTETVGMTYGTIGIIFLVLGGILGGT